MKRPDSVHSLEHKAAQALKDLLVQVSVLELSEIKVDSRCLSASDIEADVLASVHGAGNTHELVCEVTGNGQPRFVRMAILKVRDQVARRGPGATPLVIAPYLTPEAQALCREHGVGYLDFEGNARLVFGGVFIERFVERKPAAERRSLKSIFRPKSAQVLRAMLNDPQRNWRVAELAEAAGVSLGHVSNVKAALIGREWARVTSDGMSLADPDTLLDAWSIAYEALQGRKQWYYTTKHGNALLELIRNALSMKNDSVRVALASFSAAQWLAPYARAGVQYFYANEDGVEFLERELKLCSASKGENILITVPKDSGVFQNSVEPVSGMICTSPLQTYLDLACSGERGREAAAHLRREILNWNK